MTRFIRRALSAIRAWYARRQLHRAYPRIRAIDTAIDRARASHRPVRGLYALRRAAMEAALRQETRA